MFTQEVTVNNEVGLHARPGYSFYPEGQRVQKRHLGGRGAPGRAKSLLGVLSLGIVRAPPHHPDRRRPRRQKGGRGGLAQLVDNQLGE